MNEQEEKLDQILNLLNPIKDLCESRPYSDPRIDQLMVVVARQGQAITLMQESMLGIIKNMELILMNQQKQNP